MFGSAVLLSLLLQAASVAGAACKPKTTVTTSHTKTIITHSGTSTVSSATKTISSHTSSATPTSSGTSVASCKLPASNVFMSVGFNFNAGCVPSIGDLRATMIFVDFSDAPAPQNDPPTNLRDFLVPDAVKWFKTASNGRLSLNVTADVSQYYRMPNSAASYNWESGLTSEQHLAYIQDALQAYMRNGARPPPAETDVLYVVPTRNAGAYMTRSMAYNGPISTRDNVFVALRTVTFGDDPFETWGYKALNHETGHTMCLPDYYPYAGGLPTEYYVGGWSIMGLVSGPGPDYFAWDKWRLGWLSDASIDCVAKHGTTEHTLVPLESSGSGTKAVVIAASQTTALVAEARTAQGLDGQVCAPGVLLYTIDTTIGTGEGPIRVLDANPSSGGCGGTELNDATLSLDRGASEYTVQGWGVTVKLLSQSGGKFKIRVNYA